jgi:hypothetical protein
LASCNGLVIAAISSSQAAVEERRIIGSESLLRFTKNKDLYAGSICLFCAALFYIVVIFVPSIILNNDQIIDGATNSIIEIFFLIYGVTILFAMIKHKIFNKFQFCTGAVASVGCICLALYSSV